MGENNNGNFFWGVLLGAAAAAIAGCVALARSFQTTAAQGTPAPVGPGARPRPAAGKNGTVRRVRRVAAKK